MKTDPDQTKGFAEAVSRLYAARTLVHEVMTDPRLPKSVLGQDLRRADTALSRARSVAEDRLV